MEDKKAIQLIGDKIDTINELRNKDNVWFELTIITIQEIFGKESTQEVQLKDLCAHLKNRSKVEDSELIIEKLRKLLLGYIESIKKNGLPNKKYIYVLDGKKLTVQEFFKSLNKIPISIYISFIILLGGLLTLSYKIGSNNASKWESSKNIELSSKIDSLKAVIIKSGVEASNNIKSNEEEKIAKSFMLGIQYSMLYDLYHNEDSLKNGKRTLKDIRKSVMGMEQLAKDLGIELNDKMPSYDGPIDIKAYRKDLSKFITEIKSKMRTQKIEQNQAFSWGYLLATLNVHLRLALQRYNVKKLLKEQIEDANMIINEGKDKDYVYVKFNKEINNILNRVKAVSISGQISRNEYIDYINNVGIIVGEMESKQ